MKSIVITGSTSGIGLGLADSFLKLGCSVTISGHSEINLNGAYDFLATKYGHDHLLSYICDVTEFNQIQDLWDAAKNQFGKVDIWINNAGVGHPEMNIWNYSPDLIKQVVNTNITGAIYGAVVALKGMMEQGFGGIYNMEGLGNSGPIIKGLSLYGTSKSALSYLTKCIAKETQGTPIVAGGLRPGMVATKLITGQYQGHPEEWKRAERIFNILSDRVETVTPWMAKRILSNRKNSVNIVWLTKFKIIRRFLTAPFNKRKIYD